MQNPFHRFTGAIKGEKLDINLSDVSFFLPLPDNTTEIYMKGGMKIQVSESPQSVRSRIKKVWPEAKD